MKAEATSTGDRRYLGVDLHKHYVVIGGVNAHQTVVLPPRRVELDEWPVWAKAHLHPSDVLVVEATGNTWQFYDETISFVARIEVANAGKLPWIGQAKVKTDKQDVMKLARLCAAGLIPQVWVPPQPVRELRLLFSHRRRLVKVSTLVTPALALRASAVPGRTGCRACCIDIISFRPPGKSSARPTGRGGPSSTASHTPNGCM
jgi:hypothetical protein